MAMSDALLPEFDHEMANTRKTLERVPKDKFGWKPHEKSFPMGHLASHLATLPSWSVMAINRDSLDIAPVGEPPPKGPEAKTPAELLAMFDENVAAARAAIAGAGDEEFFKPWTLLSGGKTVLTLPKIAVLRSFVMSHTIHHRATENLKLFTSGSPYDIAEVVASLTELGDTTSLTLGESVMLGKARRLLICEISEVMGETKAAVEEQIDDLLKRSNPKL